MQILELPRSAAVPGSCTPPRRPRRKGSRRGSSLELSLTPRTKREPGTQISVVHTGDAKSGAKGLEPLQRFGKPIKNTIGPQSYVAVQTQFDGPPLDPAQNYLKGGFVREY